MNPCSDLTGQELLCLVVNFGQSHKIVKFAKQHGISGATVFLGRGTAHNHLLELLDLNEVRKELILMLAPTELVDSTLAELNRRIEFDKPRHGIAFTFSVSGLYGVRNCNITNLNESRGAIETMHKAIFVVVDKGNAETVVDTATAAGARGATIINARGSGIHENQVLFAMAVEPEKEIVMIITKHEHTESIVAAIREQLQIDAPGNGIMFVLDVNQAYGLR